MIPEQPSPLADNRLLRAHRVSSSPGVRVAVHSTQLDRRAAGRVLMSWAIASRSRGTPASQALKDATSSSHRSGNQVYREVSREVQAYGSERRLGDAEVLATLALSRISLCMALLERWCCVGIPPFASWNHGADEAAHIAAGATSGQHRHQKNAGTRTAPGFGACRGRVPRWRSSMPRPRAAPAPWAAESDLGTLDPAARRSAGPDADPQSDIMHVRHVPGVREARSEAKTDHQRTQMGTPGQRDLAAH